MEKVKLKYNDNYYKYDKGTLLVDIAKDLYKESYKPLAAFLDNELFSLDHEVSFDAEIKFVTINDNFGNVLYQKGLTFLLVYAFKELFGYGYKIKVCHSIDKAIKIKSTLPINGERLKMLKDKMKEIVDADLSIKKCLVRRREAISYFESIEDDAKALTFKYTTNHYVTLYKLGDMYDYFFSVLPYSTGVFTDYDMYYLDQKSFILQFPVTGSDGKIPPYVNREKILEKFNEDYKESKTLGIYNVSDLNGLVANGNISDIIKLTETIASNKLLNLAKDIVDKKDIKLVLIAGPSSSGKTTTARKLAMYLRAFGYNPKPLSMDDYFKDRANTPKLENGKYDFESVNAINTDLFNDHLKKIIKGEEVKIPTFNFHKGESEYLGNSIKLEENDILIIEGLHAINEEVTKEISSKNKYKIYVSPFTDLNIDNHNMVSNTDIRLLRRIVRDNRTRGYSAEETIDNWNEVRLGEQKYIFPHQNDVDYVYNTSLVYEIGVLKIFAEPLLFGIDKSSNHYERVVQLLNFLDKFISIPTDMIPNDSILREFIGGSYFE